MTKIEIQAAKTKFLNNLKKYEETLSKYSEMQIDAFKVGRECEGIDTELTQQAARTLGEATIAAHVSLLDVQESIRNINNIFEDSVDNAIRCLKYITQTRKTASLILENAKEI